MLTFILKSIQYNNTAPSSIPAHRRASCRLLLLRGGELRRRSSHSGARLLRAESDIALSGTVAILRSTKFQNFLQENQKISRERPSASDPDLWTKLPSEPAVCVS